MKHTDDDTVSRVLGDMLRAPEPLRDLEVERALARLQAARADAPYLLLHRVLVLETALLQWRQRSMPPGDAGPGTAVGIEDGSKSGTAAAPAFSGASAPVPSRSFLRDAAVVTLGVVAGQAVWDGMSAAPGEAPGLLDDLGSLLD